MRNSSFMSKLSSRSPSQNHHSFSPQQSSKSRIQRLPNHYNNDLSNSIDFLVVFQVIQIERLSVQVETLRVSLKDAQRQQANYKNYEVQIKELMDNICRIQIERDEQRRCLRDIEEDRNNLHEELCSTKMQYQNILQKIKQDHFEQRQNLIAENDRIRFQAENVQSQIKRKNYQINDCQERKESLEKQIERINRLLKQSYNKLSQASQRQYQTQNSNQNLAQRLRQADEKLMTLKEQIDEDNSRKQHQRQQIDRIVNNLISQNQRLSSQLSKRNGEIDRLKRERQRDTKVYENCKNQLETLQRQRTFSIKQQQNINNQYQQAKDHLQNVKEQNSQLIIKLKTIEQVLSKQRQSITNLGSMINELNRRIDTKSQQIIRLKQQITKFQKEWQSKKQIQRDNFQKITLIQNNLFQISSIQQKLFQNNQKLISKQQQLSNLSQKHSQTIMKLRQSQWKISQLQTINLQVQSDLKLTEQRLLRQRQRYQRQKQQIFVSNKVNLDRQISQNRTLIRQKSELQSNLQKAIQAASPKAQIRNQIKKLLQDNKRQEGQIHSLHTHLQVCQKVIKNIKNNHTKQQQIETGNKKLRQLVDNSFSLNENLYRRLTTLQGEMDTLIQENWRLGQKGRSSDRWEGIADSFSTAGSSKTIQSTILQSNFKVSPSFPVKLSGLNEQKTSKSQFPHRRTSPSPRKDFLSPSPATQRFSAQSFTTRQRQSQSIMGDSSGSNSCGDQSRQYPLQSSNLYSSSIGQFSAKQLNWPRKS